MEYQKMNEERFWESDLQTLSSCGKAPANLIVYISPTVKRKIDLLMVKYARMEWLAYLIGKDLIVEDMIVPKQSVTSTSVSDIEFPSGINSKIIGVIHSHHTMGSTFSGTDHEYINGNHDISIVVSRNDIKAQVRWNTPCGGKMVLPAKVKINLATTFNEEEFLANVENMLVNEPIENRFNRNWCYANMGDSDVPDDMLEKTLRQAMTEI